MKFLPEETQELDSRAIEIIKQRGSVDAPELAAVLGITPQSSRRMLIRMQSWGQLHVKRAGRLVRFAYGGDPVPTRERAEYKPFNGVDWAGSTMRLGCQDHLQIPSLMNEERVPHCPPVHGCVSSAAQLRRES